MGTLRLSGTPPIDIVLRRSARVRRMSLRLSQLDGRITLTLPKRVPESEALAFARDKEAWLRGHLAKRGEDVLPAPGAAIPLRGVETPIALACGRRVVLQSDRIEVPGPAEQIPARLRGWLREEARTHLIQAADRYAAELGLPYSRITLRDTRSRWGSCTSDGALMFSWRLVLTPPEILNYVAAHEVAHLAEMNHSQAFWDTVTQIHGPWKEHRTWLRQHGAGLHRYKFGD